MGFRRDLTDKSPRIKEKVSTIAWLGKLVKGFFS